MIPRPSELLPQLKGRISWREACNQKRYNSETKKYLKYFTYMYAIHSNDEVYNEYSKVIYNQAIREKAQKRTLVIDDIFQTYPNATLRIYVFGNDSITGARKMYESKEYKRGDIATGSYHSIKGIPKNVGLTRRKQVSFANISLGKGSFIFSQFQHRKRSPANTDSYRQTFNLPVQHRLAG